MESVPSNHQSGHKAVENALGATFTLAPRAFSMALWPNSLEFY